MNRPIKFRAWWRNEKYMPEEKMYRVASIGYGVKDEGEPEYYFENMESTEIGLIDMDGTYLKIGWNKASECELMQFTGLTDKNGKEIWEGDVVPVSTDQEGVTNAVVEFADGTFRLTGRTYSYPLFWFSNSELEVIGNIYENPELLTTN